MTESYNESNAASDAQRLLNVIDTKIERAIGDPVERTWGIVAGVQDLGATASVYLYGNSTASEYFRMPDSMRVETGDRVQVAIDRRKEDRWIMEGVTPSTAYQKVEVNASLGEIRLGSGAARADTRIRRSGTKTITVDDGAGGSATLNVVGTLQQGGTGVSLTTHDHGASYETAGAVSTHEGASDPHTGYQKESEKDANSGYAGLDSNGNITKPLLLSSDTNLYRSAADRLKTDDSLHVGGDLWVNGNVYDNGGSEYRMPFRMQAGSVSVSLSASSNGYTSVSFDSGRFTQTPIVVVTQTSLPANSGKLIGKVNSTTLSSTGFDLYAYTGDGTSVTVTATFHWIAVQMTSGAAAG